MWDYSLIGWFKLRRNIINEAEELCSSTESSNKERVNKSSSIAHS